MNFAVQIADAAPSERLALVEVARDGARREWSFGEVADAAPGSQARCGRGGSAAGTSS